MSFILPPRVPDPHPSSLLTITHVLKETPLLLQDPDLSSLPVCYGTYLFYGVLTAILPCKCNTDKMVLKFSQSPSDLTFEMSIVRIITNMGGFF